MSTAVTKMIRYSLLLLAFLHVSCARQTDVRVNPGPEVPHNENTGANFRPLFPNDDRLIVPDDDPAQEVPPATSYKIIEPGFHHLGDFGTELGAHTGEIWFGLFREGDLWALRKTKITVTRVRDEWKNSGLKVSIAGTRRAAFLLRGPNYKEGPVDIRFCPRCKDEPYDDQTAEGGKLDRGLFREYEFSGIRYRLKGGEGSDTLQDNWKRPVLIVETATQTQMIYATWIDMLGDLDRDGKPDALLTYALDSGEMPILYLSSEARGGTFLQAVAGLGGRFVD